MIDDILERLYNTTHLGRLATSEARAVLEALTVADLEKLMEHRRARDAQAQQAAQ